MLFSNQLFRSMPTAYICKQLEKNIPIGTNSESVINIIKSNKEWTQEGELRDCSDIVFDFPFTFSIYSFNDIDYSQSKSGCEIGASFELSVELGRTPGAPFWGSSTHAIFFFDDEEKLIDILVYKEHIGP